MKKLLSLLLSLALILTLTACGNTPDTPDTPSVDLSTVPSSTVTADVDGDSTTEPVTVTVTDQAGKPVTRPDGKPVTTVVTTKPDGKPTSSVITNRGTDNTAVTTTTTTGKTTTTTTKGLTEQQKTVDRLFTLGVGASETDITLTGTVSYVKEVSEKHGNATFDLQVQGVTQQKTIYCYRVVPVDSTQLQVQVGQTLILTGTVQNYKGTIEFYPATYQVKGGSAIVTTTTTTRPVSNGAIDRDGIYESKEDVALYIHTYGCLPKNFVTKSQWKSMGKPADKCCGGDRFYNKEGQLPNKAGRLYYECDIDSLGLKKRNAKRIVYSNDGLVYYTSDHYATFTLLYGAP